MAAGDPFVNTYATAASTLVVQPAAGVNVMLSTVKTQTTSARMYGTNSSGSFPLESHNGSTSYTSAVIFWREMFNCKIFMTNTQYFTFIHSGGGTAYICYSGIEI